MEIWDAFDIHGNKLNIDLVRDQPIPEGLYHIVSEILVKHQDGSYLLMQRDQSKRAYPTRYEATAGGSAIKGETPKQAAIRELFEETGVRCETLDLLYKLLTKDSIYFCYLGITDMDKTKIVLQQGETMGYRWVSQDEFVNFVQSDECIDEQQERLRRYLKEHL